MALVKVGLTWLMIQDQWERVILKAVKKFPVLNSATVVLSTSLPDVILSHFYTSVCCFRCGKILRAFFWGNRHRLKPPP
jgi:hypothetical protein